MLRLVGDWSKLIFMVKIGAYEAKTRFAALLNRVEKGETLEITRHGTTIALLVPPERSRRSPQEVIQDIRRFSAGRRLRPLRLRTLIEDGRRR
jgi:prevent-host-death family protein